MRHGEGWVTTGTNEDPNNANGSRETPSGSSHCGACSVSPNSYYHLFEPSEADAPSPTVSQATLKEIAHHMVGGEDPDEGHGLEGIAAGYTYLGQFVVHDLTRSRAILLTDQSGHGRLTNLRTPCLDLDCLYGNGPGHDPHLYRRSASAAEERYLFHLGKTSKPKDVAPGDFQPTNEDLPRLNVSSRGIFGEDDDCIDPIVADARNDDNLILSQLTSLFLRVHNHVAEALKRKNRTNRESFELARKFLIKSYHKIVVHDFLSKLLLREIHEDLKKNESELFNFSSSPNGLPLEFVFGAGRTGHAMVREFYQVNGSDVGKSSNLGHILWFSSFSGEPVLPLPADWSVEWENFFDCSMDTKPQHARRISPFWPRMLRDAEHTSFAAPLMVRDLSRSGEHGVMSGQRCAQALAKRLNGALSVPVLTRKELEPQNTIPPMTSNREGNHLIPLRDAIRGSLEFQEATPLLYYLIQESVVYGSSGLRLGPLGSYIFALTIGSALARSQVSTSNGNSGALNQARIKKGIWKMPKLIEILTTDDEGIESAVRETVGI